MDNFTKLAYEVSHVITAMPTFVKAECLQDLAMHQAFLQCMKRPPRKEDYLDNYLINGAWNIYVRSKKEQVKS